GPPDPACGGHAARREWPRDEDGGGEEHDEERGPRPGALPRGEDPLRGRERATPAPASSRWVKTHCVSTIAVIRTAASPHSPSPRRVVARRMRMPSRSGTPSATGIGAAGSMGEGAGEGGGGA